MTTIARRIIAFEFEARIFVSLMIVLLVCIVAGTAFPGEQPTGSLAWSSIGIAPDWSRKAGFALAALLLATASVLRMWAGSVLTSHRVMAFRVQNDALLTCGPYSIVRNPIYAADLLAMTGFALCLPPVGLLLPVLMTLHFIRIVLHEETTLREQFGDAYRDYEARVPRIVPTPKILRSAREAFLDFEITRDGLRHNALYVLFIPGLLVSVWTGTFFHAVLIGLPGVLDWAILHTVKGLPSMRQPDHRPSVDRPTRGKKVFNTVLYAQCWEDPQIDRKAFKIGPADTVFSITSGGCNALAFLIDNPRAVIALDMSPHQSSILRLKIAAMKTLPYDELLEFAGVKESSRRKDLYERVRIQLPDEFRLYWDDRLEDIQQGFIHCGRYEGYMRLLRTWMERIVGRSVIAQFFEIDDPRKREELFRSKWDNLRWRLFTGVFLSRTVMTLLFDKAFFRYLEESFSFGSHFAAKTEHALTSLPVRGNPFLSYILLGNYPDNESLPLYLREEHFQTIRERLDRVRVVTDHCEHFFPTLPQGSIAKFNFSNIFEWMDPNAFERILREVLRVATDGAVLTYRNLLVPRERPVALSDRIIPDKPLARSLLGTDLSFIYTNYVVETIRTGDPPWHTVSRRYTTVER